MPAGFLRGSPKARTTAVGCTFICTDGLYSRIWRLAWSWGLSAFCLLSPCSLYYRSPPGILALSSFCLARRCLSCTTRFLYCRRNTLLLNRLLICRKYHWIWFWYRLFRLLLLNSTFQIWRWASNSFPLSSYRTLRYCRVNCKFGWLTKAILRDQKTMLDFECTSAVGTSSQTCLVLTLIVLRSSVMSVKDFNKVA